MRARSPSFPVAIGLILALSAVGLTYEIAAGRVLAPFFGTSLVTWTAVIAIVLTGFSIGSALGGLVAEKPRPVALRDARLALMGTAILSGLTPTVLGLLYALGARGTGGMIVAALMAFGPASVLVTIPSPLLAKLAVEARPGREGSSLGLVLAAGSVGAIVGALLAGFALLPLIGSVATFVGCGIAALACVPFLIERGDGADDATGHDGAADDGATSDAREGREVGEWEGDTENGGPSPAPSPSRSPSPTTSRATSPAGPVLVAGLVLTATAVVPSPCDHESGLSCINIVRSDGAVNLFSDRGWQAAEPLGAATREGADGRDVELVLPYTRWIRARMAHDLAATTDPGDGPRVLFVGGGGYTLPTALLRSRPGARAVAVEIDPLITRVVRENLPWAGETIAREAVPGGRLAIVHADGRTFLNEAGEATAVGIGENGIGENPGDRARFDAAVMDAFSSGSVPAHLVTLEAFARVRSIVDGPVYVNLIDRPDGPLARGVHAVLAELWPHVEAVRGPLGLTGRTNTVLTASPAPIEPIDALPDGYARTTITPARAFTDDRGWTGHR